MSRPDTYENTYRIFDKAIKDWLGGCLVDYGDVTQQQEDVDPNTGIRIPVKSILRVFATPERAFSEMTQKLIREKWMDESLASDDFRNIPLPFCSIYRMGAIPRLSQFNSPFRFKKLARDQDGNWLGADMPTPVDIPYDIHFWCMKRYTEVHIHEWIMNQIGRPGASPQDFYLRIPHEYFPHSIPAPGQTEPWGEDVWGTQLHSCKFEAITDLSDIDAVEIDRRYIRFSLLITMRAWIMHPLSGSGGIVAMVQQDYADASHVGDMCALGGLDAPIVIDSCRVNTTDNLLNAPPGEKFTLSTGVEYVRNESCGVKKDVYRLRFTFPDGGGTAQTIENFPLPLLRLDEPCLVGCRFDYKLPAGAPDIDFEILDVGWTLVPDPIAPNDPTRSFPVPAYTVGQTHSLNGGVPDEWNRLEVFCQNLNEVAFRWRSADAVVLDLNNVELIIRHQYIGNREYVADSDMEAAGTGAWTPIAGGSLSKVDYNGNQALRVSALAPGDGVEQDVTFIPHIVFTILRLQLLNVTGQWRIMLDNDAVVPTDTRTQDVEDGWTNVAMVSSPIALGTTHKIRIEALTVNASIDLDELSLRKYSGPVWGSAVPIP